MAERATGKARKASHRVPAETARSGDEGAEMGADAAGAVAEIEDAARERDRLLAELAVARARIAELEAQRDQVVNRIDWIIDSLHSLLENER